MSNSDLKEVLKEVKLVRKKIERLEKLVEERLVGCEAPQEDEVEAIKEYKAAKKNKTLDLVPLKNAAKGTWQLPEPLVFIERKAQKQLKKLPEDAQNRINEALYILQDDGFSIKLDIKKLQGYQKHYRIRVGKQRILFELSADKTIVVYAILPRETAYK